MAYGVRLLVWGEMACFTRPEMKVERVSYDVITPSAARGILEAIYWKPEMRWVVDRLHVLNPIRKTHIRRNEIASKIPVKGKTGAKAAMESGKGKLGIAVDADRQQRAATVLRDVRYGIEAHVEVKKDDENLNSPEAKHLDIFKRRAAKGQYFHHPYLGTREFPAYFELVDEFPDPDCSFENEVALGLMLNDIEFKPDPKGRVVESNTGMKLTAEPRFFEAVICRGVIEVPPIRGEGA